MDSNKSTPRPALAPQRSHGKKRVAELLESAKAVMAERGFEAATMAEIAARAGAPIGSLYRFFPNKEAVAEALIQESLAVIDAEFEALEARAAALSTAALADALLDLMVALRGRTRAMLAVTEGSAARSSRQGSFRCHVRRHIEQVLRVHQPALGPEAEAIAHVVQQAMKTMAAFATDPDLGATPEACEELHVMTRLYLAHRLG